MNKNDFKVLLTSKTKSMFLYNQATATGTYLVMYMDNGHKILPGRIWGVRGCVVSLPRGGGGGQDSPHRCAGLDRTEVQPHHACSGNILFQIHYFLKINNTALGNKPPPPQYLGAVFIHYDILCKLYLFERPTFYNHDSELSSNLFSNKAFLSVFQGAK